MPTTGDRLERAVAIMARLRAPGGCPWDREQDFDSIKPYTIEEAYEVLEAIDNRDWTELPGELGDLLLQVLFYSQMATEQQKFSIDDVLDRLADKLVRRHPHVFGDAQADTSAEVLRSWEAIKSEEREKRSRSRSNGSGKESGPVAQATSILADVSSSMPALLEAHKLSSRAARVGFEWPNVSGLFEKLREEAGELQAEIEASAPLSANEIGMTPGSGRLSESSRIRLEEELGDLFFVLVNIARYLSLDPESSLKRTNRKFKQRFQWMEEQLRESGLNPQQASIEELEKLWQQAKQQGTTSR